MPPRRKSGAAKKKTRRNFGPHKYAAFHLLLSRWLRHSQVALAYRYVTMGGTELRDIRNLFCVDPALVQDAVSFEQKADRHVLAQAAAAALTKRGVSVRTERGDFYKCERVAGLAHLYFMDLEGIFAFGELDDRITAMMRDGRIQEGDVIFITSHLGHNPGLRHIHTTFAGEYSVLSATSDEMRRTLFRRAHPSFTLFRGLVKAGLATKLQIRCLGCIEYHDSSPMGVYAYTVSRGSTTLPALVNDATAVHFHTKHGFMAA